MKNHVLYTLSTAALLFAAVLTPVSQPAAAVRSNTYSCYMYVPYEIINIELSFSDDGALAADLWQGNGFYMDIMNTFTAFYWAVDAFSISDGEQEEDAPPMDLNLIISGSSVGPFILGAGIMILDYAEIHPVVFVGILRSETDLTDEAALCTASRITDLPGKPRCY